MGKTKEDQEAINRLPVLSISETHLRVWVIFWIFPPPLVFLVYHISKCNYEYKPNNLHSLSLSLPFFWSRETTWTSACAHSSPALGVAPSKCALILCRCGEMNYMMFALLWQWNQTGY